MGKYYGITLSDKWLAHYGIKGMKWGVRKAIESGNNVSLAYHHARAKLKLAKVRRNSNWMLHDIKSRAWGAIADNKHGLVRLAGHLVGAKTRQKIHDWKTTYEGDAATDHDRNKWENAYAEAFKGTKYDPALKKRKKIDAEAAARKQERREMQRAFNNMERNRKHVSYEKRANASRALYIDISPSSFRNAKRKKR